jgi:DNA mismatch endonuclease (patch repair protein)
MGRRRKIAIEAFHGTGWKRPNAVRSLAHKLGYRFRVMDAEVPGTPHLVFRSRMVAMFTVACSMYPHVDCANRHAHKVVPKGRRDLALNLEELALVTKVLSDRGFRCETIWECQTKDMCALEKRLRGMLGPGR